MVMGKKTVSEQISTEEPDHLTAQPFSMEESI